MTATQLLNLLAHNLHLAITYTSKPPHTYDYDVVKDAITKKCNAWKKKQPRTNKQIAYWYVREFIDARIKEQRPPIKRIIDTIDQQCPICQHPNLTITTTRSFYTPTHYKRSYTSKKFHQKNEPIELVVCENCYAYAPLHDHHDVRQSVHYLIKEHYINYCTKRKQPHTYTHERTTHELIALYMDTCTKKPTQTNTKKTKKSMYES